jgi:hypothetical protein
VEATRGCEEMRLGLGWGRGGVWLLYRAEGGGATFIPRSRGGGVTVGRLVGCVPLGHAMPATTDYMSPWPGLVVPS